MEQTEPWLDWAVELQALAQAGLFYSKDVYDLERFQRIRDIATEMIARQAELPFDKARALFCCETGYQTPKLDTRAAVFQDEKILLVQERDGLWSLPGGWVDVNVSVGENVVKEAREEAGVDVLPRRVIALQDRDKRNKPVHAYKICKVFVLCTLLGGAFVPNSETVSSGFFPLDALPPLCEDKNTTEQIALCFQAYHADHWDTQLD